MPFSRNRAPSRTCGGGPSCTRWPPAAPTSCRSDAAASAAPSAWATPACPATPTPLPRCGPRSSTSPRGRTRPSTGTPSPRSGSSSKARACGPSSTATRWPCAAVTCCSPRAGVSTATRTCPTQPMAWLDGLDIPLVATTDQGFFEFGPDARPDTSTPDRSRGERLWGGPGLTPVSAAGQPQPSSPLMAYRWAHTDAALRRPARAGVRRPPWRRSSPVTPRSASPTPRPAVTRCRPSAPRCTGCAPGPARPAPAPPRPRSGRSSTAAAPSRWTARRTSWHTATSSSFPPGRELSLHADTELDLFTLLRRAGLREAVPAAHRGHRLMRLATIRVVGGTRAVRSTATRRSRPATPTSGHCSPPRTGATGGGRERPSSTGLVAWTSPRWSRGPARSSASG